MKKKFYYCETCGNLLIATISSGVTPHCCGKQMTLLNANEREGYGEKHLPVVEKVDESTLRVKVGSQLHPMTEEHGIIFICLETTKEFIIRYLETDKLPEVEIKYIGIPQAVYAYCNLHGLWYKELTTI